MGKAVSSPEAIIPGLGGGARHWKKGRSAYELAHSWIGAGAIPTPVAALLATAPELAQAQLIEAHFERETALPGRGKPSQTDLLALCETASGAFAMAVEGKVDEPLGDLVAQWNDGSPNRLARLRGGGEILGGTLETASPLRYQLLHRTAAALIEARGFGLPRAVMLVHSFDPGHAWHEDFARFCLWMGVAAAGPGKVSGPIACNGIALHLCWCADTPAS